MKSTPQSRQSDRASIARILNIATPSVKESRLSPTAIPVGDPSISPKDGSHISSSLLNSLPKQVALASYDILHTPAQMQQTPNQAHFTARHPTYMPQYYDYAENAHNNGMVPAHSLTLPGPTIPILHHSLSRPTLSLLSPLLSPAQQKVRSPLDFPPSQNQGVPIHHDHQRLSLPDGFPMQQVPQLRDNSFCFVSNRFAPPPTHQLTSHIPQAVFNYGHPVMAVQPNSYFYTEGGIDNQHSPSSEYFAQKFAARAHISPSNLILRNRRFRRRYHQIYRKYKCLSPGCSKSYGSLNHLNTHIVTKNHGHRMSKAECQDLAEKNDNHYPNRHSRSTSDSACLSPDGSESASSTDDDNKKEE